MNKSIYVVGATGNLGGRIAKALTDSDANVVAVVRNETDDNKLEKLKRRGVEIKKTNMASKEELTATLIGASVVVSALQGLEDVIVDAQSILLEAAVAAGVSRFIPSDYSVDFTQLPTGENRNFDLRQKFYDIINQAHIEATSIFNGAFAEVLAYSVPFVDIKNKSIGYWDSPEWKVDVTTMDDTAKYTAEVALDETTPRKLNIAGFQISAKELQQMAGEVFATPFKLMNLGSVSELAARNKKDRAANPEGEKELYPRWQGSQYMQSMFSTHHDHLDNDRYALIWTNVKDVLTEIKGKS